MGAFLGNKTTYLTLFQKYPRFKIVALPLSYLKVVDGCSFFGGKEIEWTI